MTADLVYDTHILRSRVRVQANAWISTGDDFEQGASTWGEFRVMR